MKDQCKKNVALHLRSHIPIPQYWPVVSYAYDILMIYIYIFKLPRNSSHIKFPVFTSALIILRYDMVLYAHIAYIHSKHLKKGSQFKDNQKRFCNIAFSFFDSKLNSMGGVWCSATISE